MWCPPCQRSLFLTLPSFFSNGVCCQNGMLTSEAFEELVPLCIESVPDAIACSTWEVCA